MDSAIVLPFIENLVSSRSVRIRGSKIGKDNTGYSVPFEDAFEIIAAIIVEDIAIPKLPRKNASVKSKKFLITNV